MFIMRILTIPYYFYYGILECSLANLYFISVKSNALKLNNIFNQKHAHFFHYCTRFKIPCNFCKMQLNKCSFGTK